MGEDRGNGVLVISDELMRFTAQDCCDVCREIDGELVYCDKCNVAVHSHCYGAPLSISIPADDWICDSCSDGGTNLQCVLCPRQGGAMKRTTCWRWSHLLCTIWVPETYFRFADRCDIIDILQIPAYRFDLTCCFCKTSQGAAFNCSDPSCSLAFHVPCAMAHGVQFDYKEINGAPDLVFAYCCKRNKASKTVKLKA